MIVQALGPGVYARGLFGNNINACGRVYAVRDAVRGANPEQHVSEVQHRPPRLYQRQGVQFSHVRARELDPRLVGDRTG
jgi:hypothetical protein